MIDTAVIGAGPAGCSAAVQCKRLGLDVLLIDKMGKAGGLTGEAWRIENYPGVKKPLSGSDFTERLQQFISGFGISVSELTVLSVERTDAGFILLTDERKIECRSVIIATGTTAKKQPLSNVHSSVRKVLEFTPDDAVIIGGGEASYDNALTLADTGCKVTLIVRGGMPRCSGKLIEYATARKTISVSYNTRVESVEKAVNGYTVVYSSDGRKKTVSTDAVLAAIGRESTLPELPGAILIPGSIITSFPGMFICGDACSGSLGQIGTAVGGGIESAGYVYEYLRKN